MLSKERKGEIALLIMRARLEEKGVNLKPSSIKEEIAEISKKIDVSEAEVAELLEEIVTDLVDKAFNRG